MKSRLLLAWLTIASLSILGQAQGGTAALSNTELRGPFTLHFNAKEWDPRTPEEFATDLELQRQGNLQNRQSGVSAESINASFDREKANFDRNRIPHIWEITLSSTGDNLLYIGKSYINGRLESTHICLNTNGRDYSVLEPSDKSLQGMMVTDRSKEVEDFYMLPFLGTGLPTFTFVKNPQGEIPSNSGVHKTSAEVLNLGTGHDDFRPGFFTSQLEHGELAILSAQSGSADYPVSREWLEGHATLKNALIPSTIRMEVIGAGSAAGPRHVFRQKEFTLQGASEEALEANSFVPESYLKKGSLVEYRADNVGVNFVFDPSKGSLQRQAGIQDLVERAVKGRTSQVGRQAPRSIAGVAVIVLLGLATGIGVLVTKRRKNA